MTTKTQSLAVSLPRCDFRIVSVLQQRTVARLARNDLVLGGQHFVDGVLVALGAAGPAGIRHRSCRHVGHRAGAIVSVLAEVLRHVFGANDREQEQAAGKQCGQPDQMLEVLERSIHSGTPVVWTRTLQSPDLYCSVRICLRSDITE